MLIEFSVTNFRSIKDKQTLSLVKNSDTHFETTHSFNPNAPASPALLHSALIYGPNASGKSNLVLALAIMKKLVLTSAKDYTIDDEMDFITPFLFDENTRAQPSEFEVHFIAEDVRYQYGFSLTRKRIMEEWLYAYPNNRAQRWLHRSYDERQNSDHYERSDGLKGGKKQWQDMTRPNALFLSMAVQLNSHSLKPVFDWFNHKLSVMSLGRVNPKYAIEYAEDKTRKKELLNFLQCADLAIADIQIEEENLTERFLEIKNILEKAFPDEAKKLPNDFKFIHAEVKTIHTLKNGSRVTLDMDDESDGTQRLFKLAGVWLKVFSQGEVLVMDELHTHLHPKLARFLVQAFNSTHNQNHAQLVGTIHDTSLLDQTLLRRDQYYFFNRDSDQASQLYPLSDFKVRKGAQPLEKAYLSGRYGAVPYIDSESF